MLSGRLCADRQTSYDGELAAGHGNGGWAAEFAGVGFAEVEQKSAEKTALCVRQAKYRLQSATLEAVRTFSPLAPVSIARPIMRQTWRDLTFLHWPYSAEVIRKLIPPELSLDTFDGVAWVALAPFVLAGVRPLGLPATPWISEFPETNVRTYVLGPDGEPGVWFFTLEADRLLGVMAARAWYKLPYRWAAMSVRSSENTVEYRSERHGLFGKGSSHVVVEIGSKVDTGDFDYFLTARFRLYTVHRSRVGYAEIDHPPWPLQHGRVTKLEEDLVENSGLSKPEGEPVVHFSRRLEVKVAPLRWL